MGLVDIDMARLRELTRPEGPVVMLNLYRFKSPEDRERFRALMAPLIGPILERVGAEIVYSGSVAGEFVADEKWDAIALVRYPDFQAFIDVFADGDVGTEIEELRRSTLTESRFMVTSE